MKTVHAETAQEPRAASDDLLTRREVAGRLKKTPRTIDSYIRKGFLPAIKVGRSILFQWSEVEKHLAENFRFVHPNSGTISNAPRRVQLRRSGGWKIPSNTVVVARPTKWGNQFKSEPRGSAWAVNQFRRWIGKKAQMELRERAKNELRGKNLACWCRPGQPCHADIWLAIVNPGWGGRTDV
jgi:excisionase family DNA binding protein